MKAFAIALAAMALLAGCGGGGGTSQPAGSVKVTMNDYNFDPSTISAPSGKAVFYLVNAGKTAHDMVIKDSTGKRIANSDLVSAGDSNVFTVANIAAGTYTVICDQQGHEALGMKATLTVT